MKYDFIGRSFDILRLQWFNTIFGKGQSLFCLSGSRKMDFNIILVASRFYSTEDVALQGDQPSLEIQEKGEFMIIFMEKRKALPLVGQHIQTYWNIRFYNTSIIMGLLEIYAHKISFGSKNSSEGKWLKANHQFWRNLDLVAHWLKKMSTGWASILTSEGLEDSRWGCYTLLGVVTENLNMMRCYQFTADLNEIRIEDTYLILILHFPWSTTKKRKRAEAIWFQSNI